MMTILYSVRMRAAHHGQHLAGAERIVLKAAVSNMVAALTERAMHCTNGEVDEIRCSVERIDPATVCYKQLPDLSTYLVSSWQASS